MSSVNVTCDRKKLADAFAIAAAVSPARTPKEVLRSVKLDATGGRAILMATDLEVGIRIELPDTQIDQPGSLLLRVDRFGLILRETGAEKLQIIGNERGITILADRSQFQIGAANPDEFPNTPALDGESCHEVPAATLARMIRRTIFSTDSESVRYALGGVLLVDDEGSLTMVSTDGRRMSVSRSSVPLNPQAGKIDGQIVPVRAIQLLLKAIDDDHGGTALLAIRKNDVMVQCGQTTIRLPLTEGRFPRWQDVFPDYQTPRRVVFKAGDLLSSVRQANVVSAEESRAVDFQFTRDMLGGCLTLCCQTADVGETHIETPVQYEGEPAAVALDGTYVAEFLRVLDADQEITMEFEGQASAVKSGVTFRADDGFVHVMMPMGRE